MGTPTSAAARREPLADLDHETVLIRSGARSGVPVVIAIHSTALGPALGGCRMWSYEATAHAVADCLALARAMTLKAAAAGLPLGGGKSVVCLAPGAPRPRGRRREAILHDLADAIELLGGAYITAEDVGSDSSDMARLARWTSHVVGRPRADGGGGDPGAFTAIGVQAAMRACCARVFGSPELAGRSVAVVGVGSVGGALARSLAGVGARLVIADVDPARRALASELGARWMRPQDALRAPVDVVAPCALGGVIDDALVPELRCRVLCGAANNQLARAQLAGALQERDVLYAPDFIVNAAGLINASLELTGYDTAQAMSRALAIESVLADVLARAAAHGQAPLAAAQELAAERLCASRSPTASRSASGVPATQSARRGRRRGARPGGASRATV